MLIPGLPRPAFDPRSWPTTPNGTSEQPGVDGVWQQDGRILATVALPAELAEEADMFALHPALMAAALRMVASETGRDLTACADVVVFAEGATSLRVRVSPVGPGRHLVELADQAGEPVAVLGPLALGTPATGAGTASPAAVRAAAGDLVRRVVRRDPVSDGAIAERLAGLGPADQHRALRDLVRDSVLAVLGHHGSDDFDETVSFKSLGFDSLSGVRLRNRLHDFTGLSLPSTLVFDHPTTESLAAHPASQDRRWPRHRHRAGHDPGCRRADRDRRYGVPAARWRRQPRVPVGTGDRAARRGLRLSDRPRLGR